MDLERHIGLKIRRLNNKILSDENETMKIVGLTRIQGRVLHYILHKQMDGIDCFQKDVEERFSIKPSSATEIIRRLEDKGYIEKEEYPDDKRMKKLIVKKAGIDKKNEIVKRIISDEQKYRKGIDEDKLDIFFEVINQILENVEVGEDNND